MPIWGWILTSSVGGIALGGSLAWLWQQQRLQQATNQLEAAHREAVLTLTTENTTLTTQLEGLTTTAAEQKSVAETTIQRLETQLSHLRTDTTQRTETLTAERSALETKVEELQARLSEQTKTWQQQFEAFLLTQSETLKNNLTEKAKADYDTNQAHLHTRVTELLKPLNETLKSYQQRVEDVHKLHNHQTGAIEKHLDELNKTSVRLAGALSSNKGRGNWGEIQLIRLLEDSGLLKDRDYSPQFTLQNGKRPDIVINLPEDRLLIIDVKTILEQDNPEKTPTEKQLATVNALKTAIQDLAKKQYQQALENTTDFVILYVPLESTLSSALAHTPELPQWAKKQGVMLAGPLNMMVLLQLVNQMWQYHQLSKGTQTILKLGQDLYKQVATAHERMDKVGKAINTVNNAYDGLYKAMAGQQGVFKKVKKLEAYGCDQGKPYADASVLPERTLTNTETSLDNALLIS